jgi:hypothetical protein
LDLEVAERRAEAAEKRLRDVMAMEGHWPLHDVLEKLADAADHLLKGHDCDAHGHEVVQQAAIEARRIVGVIKAGGPVR